METQSNITDTRPEFLSPLASQILEARADAYRQLVVLGPTSADSRKLLDGVRPEQLLTLPIRSLHDARALLGGLWLWHDALHECHTIVQDLIGPTGSFWHAIMHRREGDFSNAKYWYTRAADHRALRLISALAMDAVGRSTHDEKVLRVVAGEYNPEAFVDLVEEVSSRPDEKRMTAAIRLQQIEWEALFHYCAYEATGAPGGMI